MHNLLRAAKEAFKFTFWVALIMTLMAGVAAGIVLGVDRLPLIDDAKLALTFILWTIEACFVIAFFGSL